MASAFLEITLNVAQENRPNAGAIYTKYKQAFLSGIPGARSKELLLRPEDVQVLHGFDTIENAANYLNTQLFQKDVVRELQPFLAGAPEVRIYECV